MIKLKNIEDLLPGLGAGIAVGALAYYYLEVTGHHTVFDRFFGIVSDEKHSKDKEKDKESRVPEHLRKRLGRKGVGEHNRDMKLGASGFKRIHNKRGTISVNGKRRLVEPDDGFDASMYDYERTFGDPKIENFSYGGISI